MLPLQRSFPDTTERTLTVQTTIMMLVCFLLLLLITGGSTSNHSELLDDQHDSNKSSEKVELNNPDSGCSYHDVVNYLNLTKNKDLFTMTRPVANYKATTLIDIQMVIYAIIDVREIDQTFIPYIWVYMRWHNHHIYWDKKDFCGLKYIVVPTEVLWKPDLSIEEIVIQGPSQRQGKCVIPLIPCTSSMTYWTEKDKAPPSLYLSVSSNGEVELRNDQVLVSTCRMQVYKFPFDVQRCNLSFKSAIYSDEEIKFEAILNSTTITAWSREVMPTQSEWLLINMSVTKKTVNTFGYNQSVIVYTITMKRRSALYIANFLLPVMFFLCLDLASFLISDSGGEKLGFKVTVLLAVTVMQLLLNEILPASSDRIPIIAAYCIGCFSLMMLSLLETIFVMYLMGKDEPDKNQSLNKKNWTNCACVCDVPAYETSSEMISVAKEGSSSRLTDESNALEKVSDELRVVEKTLAVLLNSTKEENGKPGYWAGVVQTINKVFFIFYVTVASLFLVVIFIIWNHAADE